LRNRDSNGRLLFNYAVIVQSDSKIYRFPFIRPVVPPVAKWAHYLEPAYRAKWFSNFGPVVHQFETELSKRLCHPDEVITTANSCTSGIAAALIARNVSGTVLVPAFTFPATVSAVIMARAEPCVLDVDRDTWCLSASLLDKTLDSEKCGAVVLVAPFGLQQNFTRHFEICAQHGVPVLIDNAAGLSSKGMSLSHESCFEIYSLHATKPFAIGEGGAIRSGASQAEALRRALNFGLRRGSVPGGWWGINGKLPEFSAAIGLAVLEDFDRIINHRRAAALRYVDLLKDFDQLDYPTEVDRAPWQVFPVLLPSSAIASQFIDSAAEAGLQVRRGYHRGLEDWPGTRKMAACPNARWLADRMVALPIYSDITEDEVSHIIEIVRRCLEEVLTA
jgi:dTDP-4-amino-4,6-dideoxygalactose transaminase